MIRQTTTISQGRKNFFPVVRGIGQSFKLSFQEGGFLEIEVCMIKGDQVGFSVSLDTGHEFNSFSEKGGEHGSAEKTN